MSTRELETLSVNGQPYPWAGQTLVQLLRDLGVTPDRPGVATAVNAELVRREEWSSLVLAPGDRIEIVQASAGG